MPSARPTAVDIDPTMCCWFPEALQQRLAALEQERAEFIRLKQQLEAEFNQKRAKFKELYLSKEGMDPRWRLQMHPWTRRRVVNGGFQLGCLFFLTEELKRQTAALDETRVELDSVQNQLALARSEIETIKAVATVSENTKQEAIDQVRSQWQEEVASLQAIMKGKDSFTDF